MERDVESELNPGEGDDVHEQSCDEIKTFNPYAGTMKKVQLMGILNCTPDSYYDGGKYFDGEKAVAQGLKMVEEGADWIDIGGESTRPDAAPVSEEEEMRRVIPVIRELKKKTRVPLSIDTRKPKVAECALEAGASLINDITGLASPQMRSLVAQSGVPVCVMHMQGTPQTMQEDPSYPKGVVQEICAWFERRTALLINEGISPHQIILDPGIGFGKTIEHNLTILRSVPVFKALGFPILIGLSRKSFMQKILNKNATEVLATTLALNTMSILEGVDFIRVHDVQEHKEIIDVLYTTDKA